MKYENNDKNILVFEIPDDYAEYSNKKYSVLKNFFSSDYLDDFSMKEDELIPLINFIKPEMKTAMKVGKFYNNLTNKIMDYADTLHLEYAYNQVKKNNEELFLNYNLEKLRKYHYFKLIGKYEKEDDGSFVEIFRREPPSLEELTMDFEKDVRRAEEIGISLSDFDKKLLETSRMYDKISKYNKENGLKGWVYKELFYNNKKSTNNIIHNLYCEIFIKNVKGISFSSMIEEVLNSEKYDSLFRKELDSVETKTIIDSTLSCVRDLNTVKNIVGFSMNAYMRLVNKKKERKGFFKKLLSKFRNNDFNKNSEYAAQAFIDPADFINIHYDNSVVVKSGPNNCLENLIQRMHYEEIPNGFLMIKESDSVFVINELENIGYSYIKNA